MPMPKIWGGNLPFYPQMARINADAEIKLPSIGGI
jgi:hypothetical protein